MAFQKSNDCPTNEMLLQYLQPEQEGLTASDVQCLDDHLAHCEFCELSLELLQHAPKALDPRDLDVPPVPAKVKEIFQKPITEK